MNRKIYASIAALTLLCGAGVVTSYAVSNSQAPAIVPAGVPEDQQVRPYNPEIKVAFDIKDGTPCFKATITVPKMGSLPDYSDVTLTKVNKVTLSVQGASYSDPPTVIKEWTDCTPGEELEYYITDPTLELGKEYVYIVTATQDVDSYGNRAYAKFALTPRNPESATIAESADGTKLEVTYVCPPLERNIGSSWDPTWAPLPEGVKHTKIELFTQGSDYSELILDTHLNPEVGQEFKYIDENPKAGTFNNYYVRVSTDYGDSGYSTSAYFFGDDLPGKIQDLTAVEKGGKVELTWSAPTQGYNNGRFDPSKTVYDVYRMYDNYGSDMKLLAEDYTETSYVDELDDLTEEKMVWYRVIPKNDVEPTSAYTYNYGETVNGMLVGPASKLPYAESFNSGTKWNKGFDKLISSDFHYSFFSDYYVRNNQWSVQVSESEYLSLIAGIDGGTDEDELGPDAYFYVTPAKWYENLGPGYLTTGKLDFSDSSNPVISFWYVPINDNNGQMTIQVSMGELDGDGNPVWETVGVQKFDDPLLDEGVPTTELKWQKTSFPMPQCAGVEKANVRLAFEYTSLTNRYPMCIDQLEIDDYPAAKDLAVAAGENDALVLTWDLPESAGDKTVTYNIYQGDEKIADTADKTYTFTGAEQGETYSFAVEAVYADGVIAPKSEPVSYEVGLSTFVVDGVKYFVMEDEVIAMQYEGEGEAVVVPAKVSYKNREFTVESLSAEFLMNNRDAKSLDVQAPVESVPASFAYGCVSLASVKLPASVTEISDKAFFGCAELSSFELPEAVTKVGASAFEHCEAIAEITFGEDIAEIGAAAFKDAKSLAKVTFKGSVPPVVAEDAFSGIASPCEGICPEGKENDYAAVAGLQPISFATNGIFGIGADNVAEVEYYNLSGARVAEPARGEAAVARIILRDGTVKTVKVIGK